MLNDLGFGVLGMAVVIAIATLFSRDRSAISWRLVVTGLALQLAIAVFVLLTPWGIKIFGAISQGFVQLLAFTQQGSVFIFGELAKSDKLGFIIAFQVLPTLIFFASLMSVLYHLGLMQKVVQGMAWVITKVMPVSGAETLAVCANAFVGQTEAPLVIKPYIHQLTHSELYTVMVAGMATIAGAVLAAYVSMLGGNDAAQQAHVARQLICASIMAAPATLIMAKILIPEAKGAVRSKTLSIENETHAANVIEAAATGASEGMRLALNVGAMLLAFIALIALLDAPIAWLGDVTGLSEQLGRELNLSTLFGFVFAPIAWLIGVPWSDAMDVGSLLGTKVVLNEFVAYAQLTDMKDSLQPKSLLIATFALCGFANFSSIAIQIGGIGGLAPERKSELAQLGLRAVLGGTLATLLTAAMAGALSTFAG